MMGASDWGRPSGFGRDTVESCCSIDVNRLQRRGCLTPGWWGTLADVWRVRRRAVHVLSAPARPGAAFRGRGEKCLNAPLRVTECPRNLLCVQNQGEQ